MNAALIANGNKVNGEYFGAKFSGVITHARPHTLNNFYVVHIDLDLPITVFDDQRAAVAMEVTAEGRMCGAPGYIVAA